MKRILFLLPLLVQPAAAQQSTAGDHEVIQQLVERVRQLEAEVEQMKSQRTCAADASAANPKPAVSVAATQTAVSQEPQTPVMAQAPSAEFARMQFRGFSDVSYHSTNLSGDTNSFALGQFNLFITSRLSDRLSFLSEMVAEADTQNQMGVDLERLLLQYSASDYFNISVGRYHTAIGWYNTAYHHSTWMQTATGRPFLFEFEDNGGILPIHNVGLSANGRIPSGSLGLRYVAEIGNGRASRSPLDEAVQNVVDNNNGKSFNFALMARPDSWPGFQVGFSVYHDHLTPQGSPDVGQTIMAAHAIYQTPTFEWLNEGLMIRNAIDQAGRVVHTPGFYSQVSRKFGIVRPYFRYQYVNVPRSDPIFPDVGLLYGPSLGIRYDFSEFAAFKLQYDRTARRGQDGYNGITTQFSFTF